MPTIEAYMGLTGMDYAQTVAWMEQLYGVSGQTIDDWCRVASQYNVSEMDALADFAKQYGMNLTKDAAGNFSVTNFDTVAQVAGNVQLPDSNLQTVSRSKLSVMLNRAKDATGKLNITRFPASGSLAQRAGYIVGSVGSAVGAVSAGIALGKTIDSALYNANPDFWNENGMSSLNPETWNSITSGEDSWQAGLFNMIFGLDPDTGKTQAYMDANALALMALYMKENGVFDTGATEYVPKSDLDVGGTISSSDFITGDTVAGLCAAIGMPLDFSSQWVQRFANHPAILGTYGGTGISVLFNESGLDVSPASNTYNIDTKSGIYYRLYPTQVLNNPINYAFYYGAPGNPSYTGGISNPFVTNVPTATGTALLVGSIRETTVLDGVGTQPDATTPDTSDWTDVPSTLQSLQSQYPDMFNNALVWDNVQPDGSNPQLVYVPVPFPNASTYNDSQPTSSPASQVSPQIDPTTFTDELIKTITKILQQPETQPETDTQTTTQNPTPTGTGGNSQPALPVGAASALWSVYNPTQAQVDSFGAWLWSSPFETNIGKLFQNPIDGVITLHKVFATPATGASANIVVGTLDSGVSSVTVPNQYVTVDCGSVNLYEDFANVFDYPPFTSVSLYLPFIGIVPLDTNDVMRGSINVTYGVDVYTGACLAMVEVSRDGNTVNMYQYAGVCSVEYPITNVQNSQMVSGLLSVAGGVAAMMATGVAGPAALAVAGGAATAAKSNVGRSGSFSGNAGAMGIKKPYLIIQRPQTKVADMFPALEGYPTNASNKLSEYNGHVIVDGVHVEGINATDSELKEIENLLRSGVLI